MGKLTLKKENFIKLAQVIKWIIELQEVYKAKVVVRQEKS